MKKITPVVFGEKDSRKKGSTMSLRNSRYLKVEDKSPVKKSRTKIVWVETSISEGNLTDLIASFLQQTTHVPSATDVGRVILGELVDGQYSMTYSILNGKEA